MSAAGAAAAKTIEHEPGHGEQVLLRLIHISDLHFGDLHRVVGWLVSQKKPLRPGWLAAAAQGLAGHDRALPDALLRFCRNFAEDHQDAPLLLVFTGDLTAAGTDDDYREGERWLMEFARAIRAHRGAALGPDSDDEPLAVWGNHDWWGLPCGVGRPHAMPRSPFLGLPARRSLCGINFILVDSDADVRNGHRRARDRIFARGECCAQCHAFKEPNNSNISVAIFHHCPAFHNESNRLHFTSKGASALGQALQTANVSIVLCGHVHEPYATRLDHTRVRAPHTIALRCGTSAQKQYPVASVLDTMRKAVHRFPDHARCLIGKVAERATEGVDEHASWVHTLFVHTVSAGNGGRLVWGVRLFVFTRDPRSRYGGFAEVATDYICGHGFAECSEGYAQLCGRPGSGQCCVVLARAGVGWRTRPGGGHAPRAEI